MQAPRNTYTVREGSLEEKMEEEGAAESSATGRPEATGRLILYSRRTTDDTGRPTSPRHRTSDAYRKSGATDPEAKRQTTNADRTFDATCPEKNQRTSDARRTSGPS